MIGWWQRRRRARTLERRAIPDALWQLTLARFPFLAARSAAQVDALREMATLFLGAKEFSGARGLVVNDEMAVAIAAQACLPALALGLEWLDGFVGIVVHEDVVVARREVEDDDGVVHAYDEELSGEAMGGGPVMLAWRDVDDAGESAVDGYNVVVHEFAHVIDMRGGVTAGVETADPGSERGRWLNALADEHERFAERVESDEETFLDPYGAEALEEFFAVGAEAFFVAPDELEREEPRLYRLLAEFFRQDPLRQKREGGREAPDAAAP
ncbi:MAG TPA: M90 family metallopeptidase [Caldimonas sp.]|jgi:Mlc titration factor MtfA (ptsG expression regulator)|nr:M90 family metallopeptidase [Caldimonas sp.]